MNYNCNCSCTGCQNIDFINSRCYHQHYLLTPVLFNLFFKAESFAAIVIAHGTHEHSQKFVLGALAGPEGPKILGRRLRVGKGFWGKGTEPPPQQLGSLGECCKVPWWVFGHSPHHKCISDACLVGANVV